MIEPFMDINAPSPPVDPPGDLKSMYFLVLGSLGLKSNK